VAAFPDGSPESGRAAFGRLRSRRLCALAGHRWPARPCPEAVIRPNPSRSR
jgi:hypothetical protein